VAGSRQGSTSRPAPARTGARSAPSRPHRRQVHPRTVRRGADPPAAAEYGPGSGPDRVECGYTCRPSGVPNLLVGTGLPVAAVAPTALAFHLHDLRRRPDHLRPARSPSTARSRRTELGLACGAGGLTGGYLGARLKPRMPETVLRAAAGRARGRPGPGICRRGGALTVIKVEPPMGGWTTLLSCPPKVRRRTRSRWRSWPRRRWRSGRRPVRRECSRR
jgi:hypothetical protein